MVMSQMQIAGVKPDSETFSYLISNCDCEEKISKVCHVPDHLLLALFLYPGSNRSSTAPCAYCQFPPRLITHSFLVTSPTLYHIDKFLITQRSDPAL